MADFPHASTIEGVRFTAQIGVPNVIQGLFRKRALPARVGSLVKIDAQGFMLVRGLVAKYGPGPFFVRVATDEALLLTDPDDIAFVLSGSPDPFASDPETKRKGMAAFQPDALTLSRGEVWRARRTFAEEVLDTGRPLHRFADRFLQVASEEADALPGSFGYDELNDAFRRITRRVVFGDAAADDVGLHDQLEALMAAGNSTPGKPAKGYDEFLDHVMSLLDDTGPDSLGALVAKTPLAEGTPATQVVHWLFAMGDTLPANLLRAFALLATHDEQLREVQAELAVADPGSATSIGSLSYLAGCLQEAMRLWPTTPLFGRVTTRDVEFPSGAVLPEGTQVLVYNVFNHRNRDRVPYADRFAPGEWAGGDAGSYWGFNFFSNGPQGCPGAGLSVFLGQAVAARLLARHEPALSGASLSPGSLPYTLDVNAVTIGLRPR